MSDGLTREERQKRHYMRRKARAEGMLQAVTALLRPGDLAVDCGANVGGVTQMLAATGADVIAFEPDPVAHEALAEAVRGARNVVLHRSGVGVADGRAQLFRGERFDENPIVSTRRSTLMPGANRMQAAAVMEVEVVDLPARLEDWVDRYGEVAFLKLDVEGSELEILPEILARGLFEDIRLTVVELHGYKYPHLKPSFDAMRATLLEQVPAGRINLEWM